MRWSKIQTQLPGLLEGCQQVPDRTGNGRGGGGGVGQEIKVMGPSVVSPTPTTPPCQAAARHFMGLVVFFFTFFFY